MSLFPVYSELCVEDPKCKFLSDRFKGENVYIDPDLPLYYSNWMTHLGQITREYYELDNLWNLNGGKFVISKTEWEDMPMYEREGFKQCASHYIEESNKQNRQAQSERQKEREEMKRQESAFTGITMPRFQN